MRIVVEVVVVKVPTVNTVLSKIFPMTKALIYRKFYDELSKDFPFLSPSLEQWDVPGGTENIPPERLDKNYILQTFLL